MSDMKQTSALRRLDWDSTHFGYEVAMIPERRLDDAALQAALTEAADVGFTLVYWLSDADRIVPARLAERFGHRLAARKATYRLDDLNNEWPADPPGVPVEDYPRGADASPLHRLAVAAGQFSRFQADDRIDPAAFARLYELWIDRSVDGTRADAVMVAPDAGGAILGLVTVIVRDGHGEVGLLAVDESCRGKGIGRALMVAAHRRLKHMGARSAELVTQADNAPACALYQRCGYRLVSVEHWHHFKLR
jgi:dTDP-4-amino-4,6-dideoxy-D-galactose acyltransferase